MSNDIKFNKLYTKYNEHLAKICKRYSSYHNKEDGDDMLQDTWAHIWRYIDKVDMDSPYLKTFLTRAAINTCLMWNKRATNRIYFKRENLSFDNFFNSSRENSSNNCINESENNNIDYFESVIGATCEQENKELYDYIDNVLISLPDIDKKIYELKISEKYTFQEIADKLGMKRNEIYYSIRKTKSLIKCSL